MLVENVTHFILGNSTLPLAIVVEPWLMTTVLMLASSVVWFLGLRERTARLTLLAILCYAGIAILIYLVPRATSVHHWVLGTPFQYVAVGLAFDTLKDHTSAMPVILRLLATTIASGGRRALDGAFGWTVVLGKHAVAGRNIANLAPQLDTTWRFRCETCR